MKETAIRVGVYLALTAAAFACGFYYGRGREISATNVKIKTLEKIVTKTVTVRETSPDGSTKETITETSTNDKQAVEQDKSKKPDETLSKARAEKLLRQRDYSAGLQWGFGRDSFLVPKDALIPAGATAGYRLLDQVWLEGGLMWKEPQVTLGVRVEF